MKDIWQYFKDLFKEAEEQVPSKPYIHELIVRTEEEQQAFQDWKTSLICRQLLNWLNQQYVQYIVNPKEIDEAIDFLDTPSAKGFVIHFNQTRYTKSEITHLFDYLKERVLSEGYRSYVSDFRTYNRPKYVETIHRHYLKPPSMLRHQKKEKFEQKYGNITIQLLERDDKIIDIKFNATSYQDHLFQDAEDFQDLMQALSE